MAVGQMTKEILWIENMISGLHLKCKLSVKIFEDSNKWNLSKYPVHHRRAKHIDKRHHFLRDYVQCCDIILHRIQS